MLKIALIKRVILIIINCEYKI